MSRSVIRERFQNLKALLFYEYLVLCVFLGSESERRIKDLLADSETLGRYLQKLVCVDEFE